MSSKAFFTPPMIANGWSRRRMLGRLGAGALLGLGLWPGRLPAGRWAGRNFRFVVVNDTHYMSEACGAWLARVGQQIRAHAGVDFCLVAGDLTEHGSRAHLGATRDLLRQWQRPTYVVVGNHDYEAGTGRREGYDAHFPNRLNYHFEHQGWQFIGLDTTEGLKYRETTVQAHTLRWLDEQLPRLNHQRPTVVFTHFPLGHGVTYRPRNAEAVLERLRHFNLRAVFSGHFHGQTERRHAGAMLLTNACCALKRNNHDGTEAKGYFLCSVTAGLLERRFIKV